MRAWRSGDTPGIAGLALGPCPAPADDERSLVVDVHAAALNFSDLLMIDDAYQIRPPRPFTPGQEVAGVVVHAPDGCGFGPGDRVASKVEWGGFAERVRVRADMAIRIPGSLDFSRAAALPVAYTTAMVALDECVEVSRGDTVLVHAAAGGVGLAAVEIARARGARVIATAGNARKLDLARAHGADVGFDYSTDAWVAGVREETGGRGADVIVDPVGGEISRASMSCIARDGTLLIVGFSSGKLPEIPAHRLLLKRAAAKGVYWSHDHDAEMLGRCTRALLALLDEGGIDPCVSEHYGLEDLPRALSDLGSRASVGKLVLRVRERERVPDRGGAAR